MKDNLEKRVLRIFLVMIGVLLIVAIAAIHFRSQLVAARDWVNNIHAVILEVDGILSSLNAGDSALRSYLLTGNQRDQGSYRTAYNDMKTHLDVARALIRSDKTRLDMLQKLEELIGRRVDIARKVIETFEQKGLESARQFLRDADASGESFGDIQRQVQQLRAEHNRLLEGRDREAYLAAQSIRWTIFTGLSLDFVLLAFMGWLIRDDIAARRRAAAALEEANKHLEIKVQERTAELVTANKSLKLENLERQWSFQALDHQLRYHELIINSIGDLVFVISCALRINRINPAVVHQTKLDSLELIRRPITELLQLSTAGSTDATLTENSFSLALKENREIQEQNGTLWCKGGQALPIRFTLIPLRDQDKVVGGVLTVKPCKNGSQN